MRRSSACADSWLELKPLALTIPTTTVRALSHSSTSAMGRAELFSSLRGGAHASAEAATDPSRGRIKLGGPQAGSSSDSVSASKAAADAQVS